MAVEWFCSNKRTRVKSSGLAWACINASGQIFLSIGTMRQFELKPGMYFRVGYDCEAKTIYLKQCNQKAPGCRKLSKYGFMSVWTILKRFGLLRFCRSREKYVIEEIGEDLTFSLLKNAVAKMD